MNICSTASHPHLSTLSVCLVACDPQVCHYKETAGFLACEGDVCVGGMCEGGVCVRGVCEDGVCEDGVCEGGM